MSDIVAIINCIFTMNSIVKFWQQNGLVIAFELSIGVHFTLILIKYQPRLCFFLCFFLCGDTTLSGTSLNRKKKTQKP